METTRVLVVGGTRGLGLELAREALARGMEPIVMGRSGVGSFFIDGIKVRSERMNVEDDADVRRCVDLLKTNPSLNIRYLFYTPAIHYKGLFSVQSSESASRLFQIAMFGLMSVVRHFDAMKKKPYHLILIGSTTSWRTRPDEAVYGAAKAAQAQFVRNMHFERTARLADSRTLIAHPGGMRTTFLDGSGVDTSSFLDPASVARSTWNEILLQEQGSQPPFQEIHILRQPDGTAQIEHGSKAPQLFSK